jgi:hypothetical protein
MLINKLCPAKAPCENTTCWARPLCECAKAEWAANNRFEGRVWMAIGVLAVIALVVALVVAFR